MADKSAVATAEESLVKAQADVLAKKTKDAADEKAREDAAKAKVDAANKKAEDYRKPIVDLFLKLQGNVKGDTGPLVLAIVIDQCTDKIIEALKKK